MWSYCDPMFLMCLNRLGKIILHLFDMNYTELQVTTNFSFLRGTSCPSPMGPPERRQSGGRLWPYLVFDQIESTNREQLR